MTNGIDTAVLGAAAAAHPVFEKMGWTYYDGAGVPTVERIADTIQHLVDEAESHFDSGDEWRGFAIGTGRFFVYLEDEEGNGEPVSKIFLDLGSV